MVLQHAVGLAALAVGGYLLYAGGRSLYPVYHILRNGPRPIRNLHGHTGPVEIDGVARPADDAGTVTAPFSGTDCLAFIYEVEELRSSGKHSHWETLDQGMGGVDFLVEDETGAVRVNPDGADIRLSEHTVRISPGDELPERLAQYVASAEAVDPQDGTIDLVVTELNVGNEQRFTERRLDIDESVYVYGLAGRGPNPEWGSNLVDAVVRDGPGTPVFVISDTDERTTAWRFARDGLVRLGLGLLLVVVGVWAALAIAL